jgi:hypothetical protein
MKRGKGYLLLTAAAVAVAAGPALAAGGEEPANETGQAATIEQLEEKIDAIAEEVADLKSEQAVPDEIDPNASFSGLGPAASKVYRRDRGLSIGGYGDVRFRHFIDDDDGDLDIYDALRFVLYTGYKFNDWLVLNSEVEFEHADTGSNGDVAVEFLTLDFLVEDWFNVRTGLLLIPMGFLNEVHEPPFYFGAERPEVELRILPTTWRENGAGFFGTFDLGGAGAIDYRVYGVNGFDGSKFSDNGLRDGRQKGSEALAEHFAFVGRVDYDMSAFAPGLSIGSSVYAGKSGQNQRVVVNGVGEDIPDTFVHIYELHCQYRAYGLSVRGLWTQAFLDDAGELSRDLGLGPRSSVAKEMQGGYAEVGYNVLLYVDTQMSLEPFFRYEYLDTQHEIANGFLRNDSRDRDIYVVGLNFEPIPQVVLKLDYRNFDAEENSASDQIQASVGFVF